MTEQTKVTQMPGHTHTYVKPAEPPKAQIVPVKAAAQPTPPVKTVTVTPKPAVAAVPAAPPRAVVKPEPIKTAAPTPARHPHIEPARVPVAPTTTNYNTFNYGRPLQRDTHQHHAQSPQRKKTSGSSFLGGLALGLLGGGVLANGMRGPQSSGYMQTGYRHPSSQYGSQYGSSTGMDEPMTPDKFNSMLEAAIDRRGNTRVDRDGYMDNTVSTTPSERKMFKQISFNLLQRAGKTFDERDERALFIPGILDDGQNPMPKSERGTHITHFNSSFRDEDFSQMTAENRRLLTKQYAAEYKIYQREMGREEPPQYQQTAYGSPMSSRPLGFIKLFGA